MIDWMRTLSDYYKSVREHYPGDELLIVFEIDGAILEPGVALHHALRTFDREHGTQFFRGLAARACELGVESALLSVELGDEERAWVRLWYAEFATSPEAILGAHKPYQGVLDVIRWFQLQPRTHVALNTSRAESTRHETLRSLNALGREYRVRFPSDLLVMREAGVDAADAKVRGLRSLLQRGYRIVAVIDPNSLHVARMVELFPEDVLFMNAADLFEERAASASAPLDYSGWLEGGIPRHVQFIYHGLDEPERFADFAAADVEWGEVDVRFDPEWRLIVRGVDFEEAPLGLGEELILLEELLARVAKIDKRIKLDLTTGGVLPDRVVATLRALDWSMERVWFNGDIHVLGRDGFRSLAEIYPGAIIQCPVGFLAPVAKALPGRARDVLGELRAWGINRVSVDWRIAGRDVFVEQLQEWGWDVNLYNVPDLEAFLHAVLMLPASLSSTFSPTFLQHPARRVRRTG